MKVTKRGAHIFVLILIIAFVVFADYDLITNWTEYGLNKQNEPDATDRNVGAFFVLVANVIVGFWTRYVIMGGKKKDDPG